jgi:hypothetical protein
VEGGRVTAFGAFVVLACLLTILGVAPFAALVLHDKYDRRARFWKRQAKRRERKLREVCDGGTET